MGDWCLIESDPGVFSELVDRIGVKGVKFEEVWDLDDTPEGVHGLIFLFKHKPESRPVATNPPSGLFFAKQVIPNACATQAILSVLLNSKVKNLGKTLTTFKEFSSAFPADMKGLAISNDNTIREVHNSFARESKIEIVSDPREEGDDAFHFVGYVPHNGKVYELDGLQEGPIEVGSVSGSDWLATVKPEIRARMQKYQTEDGGEIRFNLLAITDDPAYPIELEILTLRHLRQTANIKMVSFGEDVFLDDEVEEDEAPDGCLSFEELPDDIEALKTMVADATEKIGEASEKIKDHIARKEQWRRENQRRRHDYVPFLLCALKHLAKKGKLMPAYEAGKTEAVAEQERKKAEKAAKSVPAAAS